MCVCIMYIYLDTSPATICPLGSQRSGASVICASSNPNVPKMRICVCIYTMDLNVWFCMYVSIWYMYLDTSPATICPLGHSAQVPQ